MNLTEFHFIRPYWLLALFPAILLLGMTLKNRLHRGVWSDVCDTDLLPYILEERAGKQSRWPLTAGAIATLLTIIALAGPTWERLPSPAFRNESALVIALDLSRSMDATDVKPSRLIRARYKIADILNLRKDGQTALLAYAGDAFTVTPLTNDDATIASQLQALKTDIMPSQGSNTGAALRLAVQLFKQVGLQHGQILLISDGVDDESLEQAAELLGPYRLSVLGVGTAEGAPINVGTGGFLKDAAGNIVIPKLNAERLAKLAAAGHGIYRSIAPNDSDIDGLLKDMDRPNSAVNEKNPLLLEQWSDKGPWLLLLVIPFAALSFRKGLLSLVLFVLLPFPQESSALEWRDLWQTQDQQATQAFEQQHFDQAAKQFRAPEWKAAAQYKAGEYQQAADTLQSIDNADAQYNRGNALAKAGQLQQALKAYQQALQINPNHQDARYNKELVEQALQKQQQQQNQSQPAGKDSQTSDQKPSQQSPQDGKPQPSDEQQKQDRQQESDSEQQTKEKPQDSAEQKPNQAEQNKDLDAQQQNNQVEPSTPKQTEPEKGEEPQNQESTLAQQPRMDESEQASEQWLKRIPDDPSGLLRRKFKYQYGKRGHQESQQEQSW